MALRVTLRINGRSHVIGGLDARTVNGGVRVQFAALGQSDITLGVVNGAFSKSPPIRPTLSPQAPVASRPAFTG